MDVVSLALESKMQIKNRYTGGVIYECEAATIRECVETAVKDGADWSGADLSRANLSGADLVGDLSLVKIESPHRKILAAIGKGGCLNMQTWHTCKTTHCRAGWLVTLAGDAGKMLEACYGSSTAGALIHLASCEEKVVPNFYASDEDALADIKRLAALEPELT